MRCLPWQGPGLHGLTVSGFSPLHWSPIRQVTSRLSIPSPQVTEHCGRQQTHSFSQRSVCGGHTGNSQCRDNKPAWSPIFTSNVSQSNWQTISEETFLALFRLNFSVRGSQLYFMTCLLTSLSGLYKITNNIHLNSFYFKVPNSWETIRLQDHKLGFCDSFITFLIYVTFI